MSKLPECPIPGEVINLLKSMAAMMDNVKGHLQMIADGYDPVFHTPERSAELFIHLCNPSSEAQERQPELSQISSIINSVQKEVLVNWLVKGGAKQLLESLKQ